MFRIVLAILLLLIAGVLAIIPYGALEQHGEDSIKSMPIAAMLCTIFAMFFVFDKFTKAPSAMDVYQGKTTLEITYRDSIPVDTVVIYKK